jgi:hypothetical protein
VWVGSDSRLTAAGDLLDEIDALSTPGELAVEVLGFGNRGRQEWRPFNDTVRDLIAVREGAVMPITRADLALVVRGGVPQIGDPELMARFPDLPTNPAALDGRPKAIHRDLANQIRRCAIQEPGLTLQ